jgi:hypothetical protein
VQHGVPGAAERQRHVRRDQLRRELRDRLSRVQQQELLERHRYRIVRDVMHAVCGTDERDRDVHERRVRRGVRDGAAAVRRCVHRCGHAVQQHVRGPDYAFVQSIVRQQQRRQHVRDELHIMHGAAERSGDV